MKHQHYLRNFGLLGIGTVGLAMLVPQLGDSGGAPSSQRSSFATSPKLVNYLEAQLQTVSTRTVAGMGEPSFGELSRSKPVVEGSRVATPMASASAIDDEFNRYSSTALNVRAGPDRSTARLFVLQPGARVRIDGTRGNWIKIVTADEKSGWVYASYLTPADADEPRVARGGSPPSAPSVAVAAPSALDVDERRGLSAGDDQLRVSTGQIPDPKRAARKLKTFLLANDTVMRSSPSKGSRKISIIQGGSKLFVAEWDRSWARVILSDGTTGWINAR